jgi:glycosyltransferase involved in cell wall biosynthesis
LLGSGVDEAAFRALAAQQSNVELAGQVDNVGDYLVLFDAFVFPSLHEGMGSTLLDAMAFALPIVATSVGGIVDLIRDGQNGILIEPSRPDALRDAVARLHDDPALARRLGDAGRRVAQDHSPGVMADRYLDLYRTVFDNQMATTQA